MDNKDDLITIATFRDPVQAYIARTKLQSERIDCWLADDILITLNWLYSNAYGGVKVKVRESDAQKASVVLNKQVGETQKKSTKQIKLKEDDDHSRIFSEKMPRRLIFGFLVAPYIAGIFLYFTQIFYQLIYDYELLLLLIGSILIIAGGVRLLTISRKTVEKRPS